jgi:hypothetical protein
VPWLGGLEAEYPPEPYEAAFTLARLRGLGSCRTRARPVGAGPCAARSSRSGRHGSGTGSARSRIAGLVDRARRRGTVLDVCPLSNLRTGVVASLEEHPLPQLVAAGVRCSISTDDPAMFDTDLTRDYEAAPRSDVSPRAAYEAGSPARSATTQRASASVDRRLPSTGTIVRVPPMAIAREAEPVGSLHEVREAGLDREDLFGIYRNMLVTRGVEERGHILYRQGKIPGSFYTGRGNEAAAVGVATAMGPQDVGTPLHRDMGVHIVRGVEPWKIFAQFMGRADGPTRGRDGNVHLADAQLGLIAMVSHLPAMLPVATGAALAFRIREERRVAIGWFGEGSSARGDAHESMTFAGTRKLRSSSSATTTSGRTRRRPSRVRDRARRRPRRGLRLRGSRVDGTDVLAVYREAKRAIDKARAGAGRPARVPDAADGGPRRPRRRVLRPEAALRAVGRRRIRSSASAPGSATTPS